MSRVVVSKPNDLKLLHRLVVEEIQRLNEVNKQFSGNVDDMEEFVSTYRTAQDLRKRLEDACPPDSAVNFNDNSANSDNNNITGVQ